ncbi:MULTISPECIES: hypothetical protein [Peribacillus]|uniref:hypothetical protein n=1 Tax=Peribacillus TaxID=2675229 RepID=UPI001F4DD29F|nr:MULTISPECIES: hypothetical protein [unclassified Peribacillus]MCK1982241.1 hypothetical protein [Peribacillus sp. Aquil_B1]MCK2007407.1 hypothetical protein [Peribacillus sp. Aquil_B8]
MDGQIKVLDGVFPVTVAEAVYVEPAITLKQAIQDGTLGGGGGSSYQLPTASATTLGGVKVGTGLAMNNGVLSATGGGGGESVSVSGRGHAIFSLRGGVVNVKKDTDTTKVNYSFPTLDTNRYRRLFVWKPSGTGNTSIDLADGTLEESDALIYNLTTNTVSIKNGSWGNVAVSQNEYLLLYNTLGIVGGLLSHYCVYGGDSLGIPVKELEGELISNTGSTQGTFIVGDNIYKCYHSNDEHTDFMNITAVSKTNPNTTIKTITHNLGHMNAPDYSAVKDSLIVGNGSKSFTLLPKGWILPNFAALLVGTTIDFNAVDKIELDFSQLVGEWKGQLCWGYGSSDIVYLFTNDNRILRKILLGKGTNNLGSGTFIEGSAATRYNGSYSILNTWYSRTVDTLGGMFFHEGYIYTGVKGANNIRKCIPLNNGYFDSEYRPILNATGDMQGVSISDGQVYAFTDYKGYKFSLGKL